MLKDKDISQRTFGFISFSFLAHIGMITAAFLIPNVLKEASPGSQKAETFLVESTTPSASLGESAQALSAEPAQVMTAPVDDTSAIVVAKNEVQPLEAKPVVETKLPPKKVAAAPLPARVKAETATKKVLALPAKRSAAPTTLPAKAAQKVQTADQSDLAITQALKSSRDTEERPEVAADIEVPEVTEQPSEEVAATEESSGAVAANEEAREVKEETVQSATTTSNEETAQEAPAAMPVPAAKPAPSVQAEPQFAPIQRGAQTTRPAGQVGGLGTVGAPAPTTESQGAGSGARGNGGGAAGVIRDADSLSEQPGNAKPSYADDDQRAGRQGVVVFDAVVTKEGTVQSIQMKQSSGHSSLDSSAYEAFRKHRYLPGQEGTVRKKFQFVLNGEQEVKSRLRRR